jgi:bifunctional lysine-specific demethylase and histidyl-hydroxylase NO66
MATTPTQTTPTRTTHSAAPLLRAIAPVEAEQFVAEHWEAKPLVVPRAEEGRFDDLLSVRDVERLITETALRTPGFRLVKAGATVTSYTIDLSWRPEPFSGVADVPRVLAEFESGATIVLQGLHHSWLPLARYCRGLEAFLGHPAQANAYFTPRGSQGLPVHHDTHEVFSLQVAGEKRWLVYEPVLPLPLKDQRYRPELGEPGEPVLDVTLRPGDTLYLPRGWLHEAATSATDSLHITVGVNVHTWLDAFRAALDDCGDELAFRRAVDPAGEEKLPGELLDALAARLDPASVRERQRERFVRTRRPVRSGQLSAVRALDSLTRDTLLERRETAVADLVAADGGVRLSLEGKTLVFPTHVREEVEHAARAATPFRPRELPGELDDAGRLVLVRRLVREGFLRVSEE